jgi:winged helix DNA-binding protein
LPTLADGRTAKTEWPWSSAESVLWRSCAATLSDGSTVTTAPLDLTRDQILAHRRAANELEERLPYGPDSLRRAAWAGLADSMPRAALLSIHARVAGTQPSSWEDAALVQLWGPRYSAYVVPAADRWVFSLGRLPSGANARRRAEDLAARLHAHLGGRRIGYGQAGPGIGVHPNALRYAAQTGTVLIRWEGARQPTVWTVPRPAVEPLDARLELARRYLHVFGPATAAAFRRWAGIESGAARGAFDALKPDLTPVRTPIGDAWILAADEPGFHEKDEPAAGARLLPSGDAFYLLHGADRELMVPQANLRPMLWTPRVWPGALLVGGEIAGTWRRADADLTIEPWRRLSKAERDAVQAEAESLPLPGLEGRIRVSWTEAA